MKSEENGSNDESQSDEEADLPPKLTGVECISAMKQVYAYAVSTGASVNDLLKISQAQIAINCIQQKNLQQCGIRIFLRLNPEK